MTALQPRRLTAERLRELLDYDPETGVFRWKVQLAQIAPVGARAGSLHSYGYIHLGIEGRTYKAHRLAVLYMTGDWPPDDVDHRDLNKANNKWTNLRLATRSQNVANGARRTDNRSGFKGVTRRGNKWEARIRAGGLLHYLGLFETTEAAHEAYCAAAAKLHGEFARAA